MAGQLGVGVSGVPRAVRAIQVVLFLDALLGVVGLVATLPVLIRLNQWAASTGHPARPAAPVGGPQTHFSMLGSASVGTPWVGIVLALALFAFVISLTILAARRSKWVAYAIGALGAIQVMSLSLIGLLLIGLVTARSARRFYWSPSSQT